MSIIYDQPTMGIAQQKFTSLKVQMPNGEVGRPMFYIILESDSSVSTKYNELSLKSEIQKVFRKKLSNYDLMFWDIESKKFVKNINNQKRTAILFFREEKKKHHFKSEAIKDTIEFGVEMTVTRIQSEESKVLEKRNEERRNTEACFCMERGNEYMFYSFIVPALIAVFSKERVTTDASSMPIFPDGVLTNPRLFEVTSSEVIEKPVVKNEKPVSYDLFECKFNAYKGDSYDCILSDKRECWFYEEKLFDFLEKYQTSDDIEQHAKSLSNQISNLSRLNKRAIEKVERIEQRLKVVETPELLKEYTHAVSERDRFFRKNMVMREKLDLECKTLREMNSKFQNWNSFRINIRKVLTFTSESTDFWCIMSACNVGEPNFEIKAFIPTPQLIEAISSFE